MLLTGPFVGIVRKSWQPHTAHPRSHRGMLTGAGRLLQRGNWNAHHKRRKWQGPDISAVLNLYLLLFSFFFLQKHICQHFSVFSSRAERGEYVLRVFGWGHHCSAAERVWDTPTHEADREDRCYICECILGLESLALMHCLEKYQYSIPWEEIVKGRMTVVNIKYPNF